MILCCKRNLHGNNNRQTQQHSLTHLKIICPTDKAQANEPSLCLWLVVPKEDLQPIRPYKRNPDTDYVVNVNHYSNTLPAHLL